MILENVQFFNNETTPKISTVILSNSGNGSSLFLEVTGTATAIGIEVQGKGSLDGNTWSKLAVINRTTLDLTDNIPLNGMFETSISGIQSIRLEIKTITGGNISVIGKMLD